MSDMLDHLWDALEAEQAKYAATLESAFAAMKHQKVCKGPECNRAVYAAGLCNAHYLQKNKGKPLTVARSRAFHRNRLCLECNEPTSLSAGWGLCRPCYRNRRLKILKTAAVEAKGGCCSKCGGTFPLCVYDFHHIGDDKEHSVAEAFQSAKVVELADELNKCVVLCANCHRIEHYG